MNVLGWSAVGVILTFCIFLASVIFKMGHLTARVEALESWRVTMRADMHEISEKLSEVGVLVKHLTTLIEERTERRMRLRVEPGEEHSRV